MKVLKLLDKLNEEQKCLLGFSTALAILLALVMFLVTPVLEEAVLAKEEVLGNEQKLLTYERYAQQKGPNNCFKHNITSTHYMRIYNTMSKGLSKTVLLVFYLLFATSTIEK